MTPGASREVVVNVGDGADADEGALTRAVIHVLDHEGVDDAEISLTLLDDDGITELNRQYLSRDRPTDVIAFTLGGGDTVLGDIYVGLDQARRQADDLGLSLDEELVRLAVHGTLHVLGHDHPEGPERTESPMFALQEELVRQLRDG